MIYAQAGGSIDPLITLAQYGILGLLLVLTATGFIWWKPSVDDLRKRLERTEQKLDRHQQIYEDIVIPTLKESNDALTRITQYLWEAGAGGRKAG